MEHEIIHCLTTQLSKMVMGTVISSFICTKSGAKWRTYLIALGYNYLINRIASSQVELIVLLHLPANDTPSYYAQTLVYFILFSMIYITPDDIPKEWYTIGKCFFFPIPASVVMRRFDIWFSVSLNKVLNGTSGWDVGNFRRYDTTFIVIMWQSINVPVMTPSWTFGDQWNAHRILHQIYIYIWCKFIGAFVTVAAVRLYVTVRNNDNRRQTIKNVA